MEKVLNVLTQTAKQSSNAAYNTVTGAFAKIGITRMPTLDLAFGGDYDDSENESEPNMCGSECSECAPFLTNNQLSLTASKVTKEVVGAKEKLVEEDKVDLCLNPGDKYMVRINDHESIVSIDDDELQ